jgi:hypothetical protein
MLQAGVAQEELMNPTDIEPDDQAYPTYAYKPSLLGAAHEFQLQPDALVLTAGRRRKRIPYGSIRRVRLSFRPVTLQNERFIAEIWSEDGDKVEIASASWKSMVEQERFDGRYREFIAELHRRMIAAGSHARFETGSSSLLYWPGVAIFAVTSVALAILVVRGLQAGSAAGAGFVAIFLVLFLWQAGTFFRRNRPRTYRPEALPADVLPGA